MSIIYQVAKFAISCCSKGRDQVSLELGLRVRIFLSTLLKFLCIVLLIARTWSWYITDTVIMWETRGSVKAPTFALCKNIDFFLQVAVLTWINPSVRVTPRGAQAWVPGFAIHKNAFENLDVSWSVRICNFYTLRCKYTRYISSWLLKWRK
jgi:hypothetical protein